VAGWVASLLVMLVVRTTRIKTDTALGLTLSVFFGLGMLLMSIVQRSAGAGQAGLDKFLFGQAAALMGRDLVTMATLGGLVLLVLVVLWKEFKLLSFDPAFAGALGLPVHRLDVVLTSLLVIAIVIGLQTVGVVLMSALIVAPAAAARQWTDRLGVLVLLAGGFGAVSGLIGALLSSSVPRLPTGPTIILVMTAITVLSILMAPRRGLLAAEWRRWRQRRELQTDRVLADLYRLASQHAEPALAPHRTEVLQTMSPRAGVRRSLGQLVERGLVVEDSPGRWRLTEQGLDAGRQFAQPGHDEHEDSDGPRGGAR
jgi:manganese/zinc/iron transport system permease protein